MFARIRPRVTFANVTSVMALFIALGGTSYAAVQLSNNSVRSKHIVNGQVKTADLAKGAVTSAKVRDGSLLSKDFKAGQLVAGAPGAQGPKGDTGATGAQGPKGDTGPRGPSFGDGTNANAVSVPQCGEATLTSYALTITQPSRVFVSGQAYYLKYGTDRPENPAIEVQLFDASGSTLLARSAQMLAGSLSTSVNTIDPLMTAGILMTNVPQLNDRVPYVLQPGSYRLRLEGWSYGNCNASVSVSMAGISLSHIVLGTAP